MSQAYDGKVDIWAAGCTLYEVMMFGRAFTGDDMEEILAKVVYAVRAPCCCRRHREAASGRPRRHHHSNTARSLATGCRMEELLLAMLRMRTKERPTARAPYGAHLAPAVATIDPQARTWCAPRRRRRRHGASSSPDASARDACVSAGVLT